MHKIYLTYNDFQIKAIKKACGDFKLKFSIICEKRVLNSQDVFILYNEIEVFNLENEYINGFFSCGFLDSHFLNYRLDVDQITKFINGGELPFEVIVDRKSRNLKELNK